MIDQNDHYGHIPLVRLLEAGTLDHTDAKNVENLPEYAVYVLSTAGITYVLLELHCMLPHCNRETSDVLFRTTRKGSHHSPKEDNLARSISEGTQKVEPAPMDRGGRQ